MGNTKVKSSLDHQKRVQNKAFSVPKQNNGMKEMVSRLKHSNLKQKKGSSQSLRNDKGENSENISMTPDCASLEDSSAELPTSISNLNSVSLRLEYEQEPPAIAPVHGDVQPTSSSSHVTSDEAENAFFVSNLSDADNYNSDNFSFTTVSLPYDEPPSHNFDDSDIQISELSAPKLPKATAPSAFLTDSVKKDLPSSYLIKSNSSSYDEMSFPTASGSFEGGSVSSNSQVESEHIGVETNEAANRSTCKQSETVQEPKEVKVFITYVNESKTQLHSVVGLIGNLSQYVCHYTGPSGKRVYKFKVVADLYERKITASSKSIWLESNIKKADYVLVCVSQNYSKLVEEEEVKPDHPDFENSLHAQYIYRRIHSEFINNGSKNYRFIPVLLGGATVENVPQWLRDTLVYEWDKEKYELIFRLIDQEQHLKPTPGPPPELRITPRYQSYAKR